jgi:hypothetical protein
MARKEGIHIPGAIYHVIMRGNDCRDIFLDNKDRFRFYGILDKRGTVGPGIDKLISLSAARLCYQHINAWHPFVPNVFPIS